MNTKLTLTIEEEIIQKAKEYAKQKNRSLSNIIEHYLKSLTKTDGEKPHPINSPIVQSLRGSFKLPNDFDYKTSLQKAIEEKHV